MRRESLIEVKTTAERENDFGWSGPISHRQTLLLDWSQSARLRQIWKRGRSL